MKRLSLHLTSGGSSDTSGERQASAYLVVGPDGDFELRQDSLHLQVPLCRVDRRLQDLVGFGGRLSFLPENRRRGEFKARSKRESGNYDVILF